MKILVVVTLLASLAICYTADNEEMTAAKDLKSFTDKIAKLRNLQTKAKWAFSSNITDENKRKKKKISAQVANYKKGVAKKIQKLNWHSYQSDDLKRQLKVLSKLGYAALPKHDYAELLYTVSSMKSNFARVRVCDYNNKTKCELRLSPEIEKVISKSRDPEELKYYWREFYDKAGAPTRAAFENYIKLNTKAAQLNGFKSGAEVWLDKYEASSFEEQLENSFKDLMPLYLQIHGYVRHRLWLHYGKNVVSKTGPIPMHLLGDMWAKDWSKIADIVAPFPNKSSIDVTNEMFKQGYTPLRMFKMGDKFFTSMGLKPVPKNFWKKSILEQPMDGRNLICHASAWDFYLIDDVRIMQCTRVNQKYFFNIHHKMAHNQYFLQYQHQPFPFRNGANPGFHKAVGGVMSLSVSTAKHLQRVKLLDKYVADNEARINQLFMIALRKIIFLFFAYTMDKYRWALFRGKIDKSEWNCAFWKMRQEYSGVEPPVVRTKNDFDAAAQHHISADRDYTRDMVSYFLQFQLYKSACVKASQYDPTNPHLPLDNCDIYDSKAAGASFAKMMSMGASKPWPDALEAFNGERNMTGKAIAEYFEPLRVWLEAENKKHNVHVGWTKSKKCVSALRPRVPLFAIGRILFIIYNSIIRIISYSLNILQCFSDMFMDQARIQGG